VKEEFKRIFLKIYFCSWFLDKYRLRMSVMIGAFGNCFGAWLKILSTTPDRFWLTFIAQTVNLDFFLNLIKS